VPGQHAEGVAVTGQPALPLDLPDDVTEAEYQQWVARVAERRRPRLFGPDVDLRSGERRGVVVVQVKGGVP
jgi:hypothetical protein